jgi:hypothetical protein
MTGNCPAIAVRVRSEPSGLHTGPAGYRCDPASAGVVAVLLDVAGRIGGGDAGGYREG